MSTTEVLLRLFGSVAMLLWGLRMVQTGVRRAFGPQLQKAIQENTTNRIRAFFSGLVVTMLVQSSTATSLITASFARHGLIALPAALAVMLGADVGTTLVAQLLSLDLSLLPYLLLLGGFVTHNVAGSLRNRQLGRTAIGLALMLLALSLIVASTRPITESEILQDILVSLQSEPALAIVLAALLAWLTHSSLATVLLVSSFVAAGTVPVTVGITLILGANLGGTIAPIIANLSEGTLARRLTLGNALMKLAAVLLVLPFISQLPDLVDLFAQGTDRIAVNFHTAFNLGLALLFLPVVGLIAVLMEKLVAASDEETTPQLIRFLDESALDTPSVALICASREVMRMTEQVEMMLRGSLTALQDDDIAVVATSRDLESVVDAFYREIKLYVTQITKNEMSAAETERSAEILLFTTNLENIGDIVDNILSLTEQRIEEGLSFSPEGQAEIVEFHQRVVGNFNFAASLFMSADEEVARRLLDQKRDINILQSKLTEKHHDRLRQGQTQSIATSSSHLELLRDLRRVHSHITSIAYPVLERAGALRKSRLRKSKV